MKKRTKLTVIMALILVMVFAACSNNNEQNADNVTGTENSSPAPAPEQSAEELAARGGLVLPVTDKPITYTWTINERADAAVRADWPVLEELQKRTGVTIEFEPVASASFEEKKQIILATNSMKDMLQLNGKDAKLYGPEGLFLPLNDLIDEHAPNLKKYLEDFPEIKAAQTALDGKMYSFPVIGENNYFDYALMARADLMEKYNLEFPTNTDEFYEFLKVLKAENPDSYPFTMRYFTQNTFSLLTNFTRIFTGTSHLFGYNTESDQYEFAPLNENYMEMLVYLNKLYSEELLDPEVALLNVDQWTQRMLSGKSFVTWDFSSRGNRITTEAASANPELGVLMGPLPELAHSEGKAFRFDQVKAIDANQMALSPKIESPEVAMRFMDYFYSDEGQKLTVLGIEGESYEMVDGKPSYSIVNPTPDMNTALRRDFGAIYDGFHFARDYRVQAEVKTDFWTEQVKLYEGMVVNPPKPFNESEKLTELRKSTETNVFSYYEQQVAEFVMGRKEITDETYKTFVDQMLDMGALDVIETLNADYKAMYAN